jgi:hypothetical protein
MLDLENENSDISYKLNDVRNNVPFALKVKGKNFVDEVREHVINNK